MIYLRAALLLSAAAFFSGCVTPARQTEALLKMPPADLPRLAQVQGVPFVNQSAGYCGPATLTMAMKFAGTTANMDDIAKEAYTPGHKGSLQQDMISTARRHGLMAVTIEGLDSLLHEIAAGHPVVIFENLAFNWYTQWHYAIVTGYNLDVPEVVLHSGPIESKHWNMEHFERSWAYSNHWGLVVLQPNQLSAAGSELAHLTSAAAFEQLGNVTAAETAYRTILTRWPKSLGAWIGLGNLAYARGDRASAIHDLTAAVRYHPESDAARNNLAVAQGLPKQ